jgi:hypothetical protein
MPQTHVEGFIPVTIGGREYKLHYGFLELESLEEYTGEGILRTYWRFQESQKVKDLLVLLWAGLLHAFDSPEAVKKAMLTTEIAPAIVAVVKALDHVLIKPEEGDQEAGAEGNG